MALCIVEEDIVMKWANSGCTLAFTAWIGGVNHQLGPDEDPLKPTPWSPLAWPVRQSILYMGLILINIFGDWIGQPAPQKLQKIKQNGIIICNAGRELWVSLTLRYNQSGGFTSLRGGSFVTPLECWETGDWPGRTVSLLFITYQGIMNQQAEESLYYCQPQTDTTSLSVRAGGWANEKTEILSPFNFE